MAECSWRIQSGNIEVRAIVPPNAAAHVSLPGTEETVEVESGTHSWSYPYQNPDAREPLSIENTVGEISDDPEAWRAMTQTLTRLIPQNVFIVNMLQSQSKSSLRYALGALPNAEDVLSAISNALAQLESKIE